MLVTVLTVAEVIYVLALTVWIVLEKRSPIATVAWILALAFLPVVGFVVYFFLGPRRWRRRRTAREQAALRIRASFPDLRALTDTSMGLVHESVDTPTRQLMALALNNGPAPLTAGNALTVLRNGQECYPAIKKALESARHHIYFQSYIFAPDRTGVGFRDLLAQKAREGLLVRLLVDYVGSIELDAAFLAPMLEAGVQFAVFHPVTFPRMKMNFRNHRKIIVCDGKVGFTGGLNIGDEYASLDPRERAWRDTHVRVEGPAVRGLQLFFLEDWSYATGHVAPRAEHPPRPVPLPGESLVQIVGSGPDGDWRAAHQLLFTAVSTSRERVFATTPYFIPDEAFHTALVTAALRGVDVEVLVPRRSDSRVLDAARRSYYDSLLKAGVRVFEYLPGMLHAKTMVIDSRLAVVGTSNLDPRSFALNFEVDLIAYDAPFALELETLFQQDLTLAREVIPEDRATLSFGDRLFEASTRLLSPLL